MSTQRFTAEVKSEDRGRVSIDVPFSPSEVWERRRRHFVRGEINGAAFEGSLGTRGGRTFMPLSKDLRARANVTPGDVVEVWMEAIAEAPEVELPAELVSALDEAPGAKAFFDGLSPFYRNQYAVSVGGAKRAETRAERAQKAVAALQEGRKQP
ncbi:MAG TPA: YdeI/OmpD-associated family protein [Solirubrobacteraceae bacterium]|nr:YdeI/OmpD-associated family protein [Solirubrobacteraceae bacterium]